MVFCIAEIMNADALSELARIMESARFQDGRETAGWAARLVKNNRQLGREGEASRRARSLVLDALRRNAVFAAAALPRHIRPPLLVRYEPDMAYGGHVDDALMGGDDPVRSDLSVTVFLNDPAEYEGGELILDMPGGEQVFKLPLGAAVVYSSTTLHRVEPVTAGARRAAVTWVQSLVRDGARREILFDLDRTRRAIFETQGKTAEFDTLSKTYANLLRMWAEP